MMAKLGVVQVWIALYQNRLKSQYGGVKARTTLCLLRALAAGASALLAEHAHTPSVLYEDSATFNGNFNFTQTTNTMAGNEVILQGASSADLITLAEVQIDLINNGVSPLAGLPVGTEEVALMFCLNNAIPFQGITTPGSVIWSSGFATLSALGLTNFTQGMTLTFSPNVLVPKDFTWVVAFQNIPAGESAGLSLYSPPIIGTNYPYAWMEIGEGWLFQELPPEGSPPPLTFGAELQGTGYPQPGTFQGVAVQSNGAVQLGLSGTIGASYTLDAAGDLH
jgi:hypothetical protein